MFTYVSDERFRGVQLFWSVYVIFSFSHPKSIVFHNLKKMDQNCWIWLLKTLNLIAANEKLEAYIEAYAH